MREISKKRSRPQKVFLFDEIKLGLISIFCVFLFMPFPYANAANLNDVKVGAIRWDAWYANHGTWTAGLEVERSLGPNKYHDRLPFFGVETGLESVTARELTQGVMDEDIAYANAARIDYWTFLYYPEGSGLDIARKLYDSSNAKGNLKYAYIVEYGRIPSGNFDILINAFKQNNYQKVLGNRPILYLFADPNTVYNASEIAMLRNMSVGASLGNPYIVVLNLNAGTASNFANSIGADAIGAYVTYSSGGGPYSNIISQDNNHWNQHKNTGRKVVPWVTTGWDPRPRIDNPVSWISYGANDWVQRATPLQIGQDLQNALDWVSSNESAAEAATVLMYAWNEFDEGGWLTPTLY